MARSNADSASSTRPGGGGGIASRARKSRFIRSASRVRNSRFSRSAWSSGVSAELVGGAGMIIWRSGSGEDGSARGGAAVCGDSASGIDAR